ncbi:unnamed protein product [Psylliodes chrysocephalus]|uniref:Uncharacterized protein n=1 Tax=Psylliodes chrysocephalus TaxID=3402493 RepID=A0A9P0D150_9CUCU|nr:unnamed protein product [Psylliodes chrysocephala]
MSRSSAKTRSDGDADSPYTDITANACSSSYRSKKDLEGGPYGDIPPDSNRQGIYKDYVVFMLQDNECSTETSDYSDNDEKELYSLRNEYLQKLNIVRKRLNLAEISDDGDKYFARKCTITEIIEEDGQNVPASENNSKKTETKKPDISCFQNHLESEKRIISKTADKIPQQPDTDPNSNCSPQKQESRQTSRQSSSRRTSSSSVEIQTLHPFSICYNKIDADSLSNLLELEYNPPKKKSCFRLHTPKLPSASESNIPYHTKVSLHDGLFKKPSEKKVKEPSETQLSRDLIEKFTVTREIQCNEKELDGIEEVKKITHKQNIQSSRSNKSGKPESCSTPSPRNYNLFPEVIVKYQSPRQIVLSSNYSDISSSPGDRKQNKNTNVNHPNYIEDSSGESYSTATTSTTILNESQNKKKDFIKGKMESKIKHQPLSNMWHDLRHLNVEKLNEVDAVLKEKTPKEDLKKRSFVQYITYSMMDVLHTII